MLRKGKCLASVKSDHFQRHRRSLLLAHAGAAALTERDRIRSREQPDTASFSIAAVMQSAARKTATWHREDQLPGKTAFELHFCETYAF